MRLNVLGGVVAVIALAALVVVWSSLFTVYQTQQALVIRLGQPVAVVSDITVPARRFMWIGWLDSSRWITVGPALPQTDSATV